MHLIFAQVPDVVRTHRGTFMQFESTLIGQLHDHLASATPTWGMFPCEKKIIELSHLLSVKTFEGE